MSKDQSLSLNEVSAEIRNKLQTSKTVLELLKTGTVVSKEHIDKALNDLEKVEGMIS